MNRGLYAIADAGCCEDAGADLRVTALALLEARPALLQLRWKDAPAGAFLELSQEVVTRGRALGVGVIINDRVDVAGLAGAHGVHLGQDDLPVDAARAQLPAGALVGLSTHDLDQVDAAVHTAPAARPDYLGFGPIYATTTKRLPEAVVGTGAARGLAAAVARAGPLPVVAIGGIDAGHLCALQATGAHGVAVISDLLAQGAEPAAVTARARCLSAIFLEARA